jgi:hypothetical protein
MSTHERKGQVLMGMACLVLPRLYPFGTCLALSCVRKCCPGGGSMIRQEKTLQQAGSFAHKDSENKGGIAP